MQYNRAILAMIASALNGNVDEIYLKDSLIKLEAAPDRNVLIIHMDNEKQFRITVEEVV